VYYSTNTNKPEKKNKKRLKHESEKFKNIKKKYARKHRGEVKKKKKPDKRGVS